jgi:N-dimethylarginine dimethylaminohydrolase
MTPGRADYPISEQGSSTPTIPVNAHRLPDGASRDPPVRGISDAARRIPFTLRSTADLLPSPAARPSVRHRLHSFDEFTRLRSIVVGTPEGANHPEIEASFENFFRVPEDPALRRAAIGPVPRSILEETEEDIQNFIRVLRSLNIEVTRPVAVNSAVSFRTPHFEISQLYSLMPRDCVLVVGDLFVEVSSPSRARYFETFAFRPLMEAYVAKGAHVVAAPKPILGAESYCPGLGSGITEVEVLFDAANCVRVGKDIFMDVNHSANRRAIDWLERTLRGLVDDAIRVHPMSLGYDHVDVTLVPLRPGVVLIDPLKVTETTIPPQFKCWDKVVVDEVSPTREYGLPYPLASNDGIGRNVLVLDPHTVIVDEIQLPLIRALEKRKFTVIALPYRHGRTLGGSWHCITLDTHREGEMVDYFG